MRGGVVGAVGHVFDAGEARALDPANFGERIGLHVDHRAFHRTGGQCERIAAAANRGGQCREARLEAQARRGIIERSHAERKPQPAGVHIALHELMAGEQRTRHVHAAAGRTES